MFCDFGVAKLFPTACVSHLDFWGSDHRFLSGELLAAALTWPGLSAGTQRWAFDLLHMLNEDCRGIIEEAWMLTMEIGDGGSITGKLSHCQDALTSWSSATLGCIPKIISKIQNELRSLYRMSRSEDNLTRI